MHPLQSAPVEEEWTAVLLRPTPEVRFDLKGLHALALRVESLTAATVVEVMDVA